MEKILEEIKKIPGAAQPEERCDGWWVTAPHLDVRAAASLLNASQFRLNTMTGVTRTDGETDIMYHFTRDSLAVNFKTTTQNNHLPSIATLIPAADWIEREIHDLYLTVFDGHPNLVRLVLPPEVEQGLYRQPGGAAAKTGLNAPLGERRD